MLDRNRQFQPALAGPHGSVPDLYSEGRHSYYGAYGLEVPEDERGFDPLKLLGYLLKYRWLILTMLAVGLVAGIIVTMMQTPKYQAKATLEVLVPSAKVFQDMEVVAESSDVRAFLTAREKLLSRALAKRVVFQLGLSEKPEFLFPTPDFSISNIVYRAFGIRRTSSLEDYTPEQRESMAIGEVLGNVSVQLIPNTSLLSITFRNQRPAFARDVANQIAQSFIDQRVDQTSQTSDLARQFIQEQVVQTKQKLQASEEALVAYAKKAGISATGAEKSLITSNIETINTALAAAIQEQLDYARLVQQIEAGSGASLEQVLSSKPLQELQAKITELEGEYQQKLGLFKPGFPEMQQLNARIRELRKQLNSGISTITDSIRLKHMETVEKETDLNKKLAELEKEQSEYNDKNIQYTILKREVDSNRSQYDTLISKLNEVGVGSELKTQNATIVDLASLPGGPYSPRKLINLAVALVLFAAIAASIIYILELLNNSFTNPDQVEHELGLPVLGILPSVDEKQLTELLADQKSGLSEAHRSLRTALQFSGAEGVPRTLLITSSEPSEGKSTTSFKLAQDFGALGTRVLVIDADLRKPNLHRLFGFANTIGLSNLLTNTMRKEDMANIVKQTRYPNVYVMTSGTIPPNPADLLSSPRMAVTLSTLSSRFDIVLVDAPPVVGLSDAPILARLTDATLMVVSTNQVTRKSAKAALKRLRSAGANVLGAAMCKFAVNKFDYNYSYKYMNYQYYAYGADAAKTGSESTEKNRVVIDGNKSLLARMGGRTAKHVAGYLARARASG